MRLYRVKGSFKVGGHPSWNIQAFIIAESKQDAIDRVWKATVEEFGLYPSSWKHKERFDVVTASPVRMTRPRLLAYTSEEKV